VTCSSDAKGLPSSASALMPKETFAGISGEVNNPIDVYEQQKSPAERPLWYRKYAAHLVTGLLGLFSNAWLIRFIRRNESVRG
jgi:hypothetical protein